ncbi:MAG: tRNA pseudouridine(13) synthase TruD [Arcobacteraceae bacterium]|nr:tRNA pseudouridine(13) synthase TruD [Arcobacteraceae bacterium]
MKTKRLFLQTHEPINFVFTQNKYDFIVEEIPFYHFINKGNFFIMKIKKEYTSTWELISFISQTLNIPEHFIGYAGLKDKNATTTQYISIPLNKSRDYKSLNSKNIKVLETFTHNQKLKIGDLKANKFKITLKEIDPNDLPVIYQTLSQIQKHGMPNYFGYQRFGKDTSFKQCKDIVYGETITRDTKLKHLQISAYQSYFFNAWLVKRVEISQEKQMKKLFALDGDIYSKDKKTITGLMVGRKTIRAKGEAGKVEEQFDDIFIHEKGSRRDAWIVPSDIKNKFIKDKNQLELEFILPKSSYATVLIENIANKNFK